MDLNYTSLLCYIFVFLTSASSITLLIFSRVEKRYLYTKKITALCILIFIEGTISLLYCFSGIVLHDYEIGTVSTFFEIAVQILLAISYTVCGTSFAESRFSHIFCRISVSFYIIYFFIACILTVMANSGLFRLYTINVIISISEIIYDISIVSGICLLAPVLFRSNKYVFVNSISLSALLLYWSYLNYCYIGIQMGLLKSNVDFGSFIFEIILWFIVNLSTAFMLYSLRANALTEKTAAFSKTHLDEIHDTYQLTNREAEILALLGKGYSNKEIEKALFISEGTVKVHLSHIYKKLHVKNRVEAANVLRS
ncbi:MAG: response regulator transcription factor [Eubacteriaceae bacterium]|nr:response regulator transcription factor [Eubacteriaceae bacterium]